MDKRLMAETHLARLSFLVTVSLSLFGGLIIIAQASALSRIIAQVFLEQADFDDLQSILGILFIIIIARSVNQAVVSMASAEVAIRVKQDLRERIMTHLLKMGPTFVQQERSGELTITATDGIEALDSFFRDYLPALFTSVLIPLAILVIVFPVDLLTFLVMLITAPLIPIFMVLIGMAAGALARDQYAWLGQMSAHFLDVMQGLVTLKLFNRSKPQIQTIKQITDQFRQSTLSVLRIAFLSAFVLELLATISVAVVAVEIGLRLLSGGIPFERALFLLVIAPEFYMPLRELGAKFHAGRDGAAAADRIYAILNTSPPYQNGTKLISHVERIQFTQVSHAYSDGKRPAINEVSLTINRGEHIALVGATGSGKSTIANLLMGFIQPDNGEIIIWEGNVSHSLNALDIAAWREHIAWVPQRSYLFNMSVADNIRIGNETATQDQIQNAAQAAAAHTFIQELPQGYNTLVGENGARLSGGEAQRVALARAFLRDVPVYIFDEATASLDDKNETTVQNNLKVHTEGRIMLTIAHRLNTIRNADKIIVMDEGSIVESGTHQSLIQAQGAYFHLLLAFGEDVHNVS